MANGSQDEVAHYDEQFRQTLERQLAILRQVRLTQPEHDGAITEVEIFKALRKMKSGKAPGEDGVLSTILRQAADAVGTSKLKEDNWVVRAMAIMFNHIFDKEVWPERWQSGVVTPLYKQGSRLEPGNYRPITLLSVVGKVFGSIVEHRLSNWSERTHTMADEQGGFRRRRGAPDLIFSLRETVLMRKAQGLPTLVTFIDARKAYDTVWREGNYVKLHNMGARGKLWRQIQAMSSDPKSKIRLSVGDTEWVQVTRGVAQGAVESPWLYSCFVNGLADALKRRGLGLRIGGVLTPLFMYADDVVLLASTITELHAMNRVASEYARLNRFRHNGEKSAVMLFNANAGLKRRALNEQWSLSGEKVEVKDQYKYLGVELVQNGDWTKYIEKITKKAKWLSTDLAWVIQRDAGLRARSACTLWRALVRPVMEYAAELWGGDITAGQAKDMEKIQTDFGRSILGLNGIKRVSNDFVRAELGMERLQSRWAKLKLGYWRRVQIASPDRLFNHLAVIRKAQLERGGLFASKGWMKGTRATLEKYGFAHHWNRPALTRIVTEVEWKARVAEAVDALEERDRRQRALAGTSESWKRYQRVRNWGRVSEEAAVFSGEVGRLGARVFERYLDDRSDGEGRRLKLWCRAGCLPVMEKIGTALDWPAPLNNCLMCATGEPESTQHLLAECPAYQRQRVKMLAKLDHRMEAHEAKVSRMKSEDLCDVLLGKSVGDVKIDEYIDVMVKRYLVKVWKCRGRVNRAVQEVVGWEWLKKV